MQRLNIPVLSDISTSQHSVDEWFVMMLYCALGYGDRSSCLGMFHLQTQFRSDWAVNPCYKTARGAEDLHSWPTTHTEGAHCALGTCCAKNRPSPPPPPD